MLLIGLILGFAQSGHAQGSVPLVTVATDRSSLNFSDKFGAPAAVAVNQAGDFAFVGNGETALFFRAAGASSATRLLQIDDAAPGFPGSDILSFLEISLNSASPRVLLFGLRFTGADNLAHAALLTYDGTNYRTVVTSGGAAPGSNGATYGLSLIPGSIDDSGDISFEAVPTGTTTTSLYIVPSGGAAVLIATFTGTSTGACLACFLPGVPVSSTVELVSAINPKLNAQGQMLVSLPGGLYIGSKDGSLSSVPMATSGPCSLQTDSTGANLVPTPGASVFLNDTGTVVFTNPPAAGATTTICAVAPGATQPTVAIAPGDPAPAAVGGGTLTSPAVEAIDDSGDIVFVSPLSGSTLTTFALLRYHTSNGQSDAVAYDCEAAPGAPSGTVFANTPCVSFQNGGPGIIAVQESDFFGISVANGGSVSFSAFLSNGGSAIYRQSGTAAPEFISTVSEGSSLIPIGIGVISFSSSDFFPGQTEILNSGSVLFSTYLTGGAADFAVYLGTPGNLQSLMSTADTLPEGARTILGALPPRASGHFVAFSAEPAGGNQFF